MPTSPVRPDLVLSEPDAHDWWRELLDGSCRLIARWDRGGRRCLLLRKLSPPDPRLRLTARERRVVLETTGGASVKLIAHELGLTPATVSGHLASAKRKIGVQSQAEFLMLLAAAPTEAAWRGDSRLARVPSLLPPAGLSRERGPNVDTIVLSFPLHEAGSSAALTPAEQAICRLILAGLDNREIAERRGRSPRTVANQIASIFEKLAINSRGELLSLLLCKDIP